MYRKYLFILFLSLSIFAFSQVDNSKILFTVNDQPVFAEEFIRVYNKNIELIQDDSQKDVDNYLQLYINYKFNAIKIPFKSVTIQDRIPTNKFDN